MKKLAEISLILLTGAWLCACGGSSSSTSCSVNDDCVTGYLCDNGECLQHDPVQITTDSLPNAIVDTEYDVSVEAADGIEPYSWSLGEHPAWLSINTDTGTLSGTPTEAATGITVEVQVQDASTGRDSTATKSYTIDVSVCVEGDTAICYEVQQDKCMEGLKHCTGGQWGSCLELEYSTNSEHCGPGCDACDDSASDGCKRGSCDCGDNAACTGGKICCTENCIDGSNDPENCGACDLNCSDITQNANNPHCADSVCVYDDCAAGYLDCDADTGNGCETTETTQICGSCDNDCTQNTQHVDTIECLGGANGDECGYTGDGTHGEGCEFGYLDCDGDRTNGCETPISSDDCGSCGDVCPSECLVHPDGDHYYCGCEVDADCGANKQCCGNACYDIFDPAHCGNCDKDCSAIVQHPANTVCNSGSCDYDVCAGGYLDCDGDRTNGCETAFSDDDCGACGFSCGVNAFCDSGSCACSTNYGNCIDSWTDGCETDLTNTTVHCGDCDTDCTDDQVVHNATGQFCQGSQCDFSSCQSGFDSCDNDRSNGCETDIWAADNCGPDCAGVVDCNTRVNNADGKHCNQGQCDYNNCLAGYDNCNNDRADGCEADIWQSTACGVNCSQLVDCTVQISHGNNIFCNNGQCDYGNCGFELPTSAWADCNGDRTDGCEEQIHSTTNCGTDCGNTVDCSVQVQNANGKGCNSGLCTYFSCLSGYQDCNTDETDGCEDHLWETTNCRVNCADSGTNCSVAVQNANGKICASGACDYQSCTNDYGDCDNQRSNGCETYIVNNILHCGVCSRNCTVDVLNANGVYCQTGACGYNSCVAGYDDCNGNVHDGCEKDIWTDTSCSPDCSAGVDCTTATQHANNPQCSSGYCTYSTCQTNYQDCDGNQANGCESNKLVDHNNCGSCNHSCGGGFVCVAGNCEPAK